MKAPVILLLNTDAEVEAAAVEAVFASRHGIRVAKTAPDAFQKLEGALDDVDAIIVDLDPKIHGTALLSALDGLGVGVPVIAVTSLEQCYMEPITKRHGAAACLSKPVTPELLAKTIARLCGK